MRIVDAQVHVWAADTADRPWRPGAPAQRAQPLGYEELIASMDEAGVDAAVLVPPSWEGDRNDLAIRAYQKYPHRFAIMGRFDPDAPHGRETLQALRDQAGFYGLRFTFHRPGMFEALNSGVMDWVWREAERLGLQVMLLVAQAHLSAIERIAQRFPALKISIDHLSVPSTVSVPDRFTHFDALVAMSKYPNVAVKVSALPCFGTEAGDVYPYLSLHPYVRRVYDAYGPQRMFWGSDLSRLPGTYRQCISMFTEAMPWLNADDKAWIMGRAVCEWLGWETA